MAETGAFFLIMLLLILWLYVINTAWQLKAKRKSTDYLYMALALWPMALVDSIVRVSSVPSWYAVAGLFNFIPVIVAGLILLNLQKLAQPNYKLPAFLLPLLFILSISSEVPLLLQTVNADNWISSTPIGSALELWWLYLPYLIVCSSLLIFAGQMFEICNRYHRYLPWQAVDINRYKIGTFAFLSVCLILLSLTCLLLVVVTASNFYALMYWPVVLDLSISFLLVVMLWSAFTSTQVLPSPLNYKLIYKASIKQSEADVAIVAKAEKVMIDSKAYKTIGLSVEEFANSAQVDPTQFLLALKRVKKKDFRGFIFHYRMEYARNIVLRTDASIARVAKRLGFHSEKFLSGPFLSYLEKRK